VSLQHIFLTQNQIVNQVNIFFFSATLRGLPYLSLLTVLCLNFINSLLMLLFVHYLFKKSIANYVTLYPFN